MPETIVARPRRKYQKRPIKRIFTLPLDEEVLTQHYLKIVQAIAHDYFSLMGKVRFEMIFYERHFCTKKDRSSLDAIGKGMGLTRERIRQISKQCLGQIKYILRGRILRKPPCLCSPEAREAIRAGFVKHVNYGLILFKSDLIEEAKAHLSEEEQDYVYHLDMVAEVFDLEKHTYEDIEYYIDKNSIIDVPGLRMKIDEYFHTKPNAVTLDELTTHLGVSSKLVELLLRFLPNIQKNGPQEYSLPLDTLRCKPDRVFSILSERGEPMHFTEINKLLGEPEKSPLRIISKKDRRFKFVGKTGIWALSSWRINNDTVIGLIKKPWNT